MRVGVAGLILLRAFQATAQTPDAELWRQVEIIRTAHGVPHIRAENLRAAGYALGWLQLEDYGPRAALMALRARGEMAKVFGLDSIESDFENRRNLSRRSRLTPSRARTRCSRTARVRSRVTPAREPGRDVRKGRDEKVAFTVRDVDASAVARYRPGEKR